MDSIAVARRVVATRGLPAVVGRPVRVAVRFRDHGASAAADGGPDPECFSGANGLARRRWDGAIPALQPPGRGLGRSTSAPTGADRGRHCPGWSALVDTA